FIYDRVSGETALVSHNVDGDVGNSTSYASAISADGGTITFTSQASDLVADDTNGRYDIFTALNPLANVETLVFDFDGIDGGTSFSQGGFTMAAPAGGHSDEGASLRWHDGSANPADQDFILTRDDGGSFNIIGLDHLFGDFRITTDAGDVLFSSSATGTDIAVNLYGITSAVFETGSEVGGATPAHIDNLDISFIA
ncbi:MAG: hypothetical protein ACPG06_09970, partial [Alphaproteobacteria bacterium]